ncbi:hypothetical protein N309_03546, partial [Tinamus guttatus]
IQNKTLTEIEAFLNNNLLTAIKISSLSENLHSSLLSDGPSSCTHDQLGVIQSARSLEPPMNLPLIATPSAKEQDKDQLGTELNYNNDFLTRTKNTQYLRQTEELPKQCTDSSLPFCENVTERKKHEVHYRSKTQHNVKNFDKICSSNPLHCGVSGSNTSDVNLQARPSDLSHSIPSPLPLGIDCNTDFKITADKIKPEETVYDADMELTASDVGELLSVTSKDKLHQNKNSSANSDKVSANFRRVKYPKEKTKSKPKTSSNSYAEGRHPKTESSTASKTNLSGIQISKNQRESEQLPTGRSLVQQNFKNTSKC